MTEVEPPYSIKDLSSDAVSKKDIINFLQAQASEKFKSAHKLKGTVVNVAKVKTKDQLINDYKALFDTKDFKGENDASPEELKKDEEINKEAAAKAKAEQKSKAVPAKKEEIKYQKKILKTGDKCSFPNKGDEVSCYYTGKLSDGKVFDTNITTDKTGKKVNPLKFKVGAGKVIRGWDEAILTMSVGEKAEVVIHPDWAYGKKGLEGNTTNQLQNPATFTADL